MVAATAAKGVEVSTLYVPLNEPSSGRSVGGEGTCRRDVIGRDGIAKFQQHLCSFDGKNGVGRGRETAEEGGQTDVGRGVFPRVQRRWFSGDAVPARLVHRVGVSLTEHLGRDDLHGFSDLFFGGPHVLEHHRLTVRAMADGFAREVHVQVSCDGVCDHKRGAGQIGCLDLPVDAPLKVAVS